MNRLFDADNPIMSLLSRAADLVWLNLLTLICCIPVVTAGAALTALYYVCIKIVRDEEGYLTRSYLKSFRDNFVQATVLWLLFLVVLAVGGVDFYFIATLSGSSAFIMRMIVCAFFFFFLCGSIYCFPLLARFENSLKTTIKNSFLLGIVNFPKSLCILFIQGIFALSFVLFFIWLLPFFFLFGISLPVYLTSHLFSGIFQKLEPEEEEISESV